MPDPITCLPCEVAILIFRKLGLRETVRCMLVSKAWYYFLDTWAVLWNRIDTNVAPEHAQPVIVRHRWGLEAGRADTHTSRAAESEFVKEKQSLRDQSLSTLARRAGPALRHLSLSPSPHITDTGLYSVIHYGCVNIRRLELIENKCITGDMLVTLLGCVGQRLECLALSATMTDDTVVRYALSCAPNLVYLDLSYCRLVSDDAFPRAELLSDLDRQALPQLQELVLSGCVRVGDTAVGRIARAFGSSLHILDISYTSATTRCLCFLSLAASMNQDAVHGARGTLALRSLNMMDIAFEPGNRNTRSEVDGGIHFNIAAWRIEQLYMYVPQLTSLTIAGKNYMLTDEFVVQIARNCRQLTSIDVRDSFRLGHASMFALSENCAGLEYASFGGCPGCLDTGVLSLVRGCSNLRGLNLYDLGITNSTLLVIGNNLHYLEVLVLDMCRLISTEGIKAVVEGSNGMGCLFTLTELSFMRCGRVDNAVVDWCKQRLKPNAIVRGGIC
ncbi:hypothetical protein GGI20_004310 [Coemansia sp. BCRC 34301]|nr:hypothetical protein GGI20_004310 [Coemansia sp. BCRC 34301]